MRSLNVKLSQLGFSSKLKIIPKIVHFRQAKKETFLQKVNHPDHRSEHSEFLVHFQTISLDYQEALAAESNFSGSTVFCGYAFHSPL